MIIGILRCFNSFIAICSGSVSPSNSTMIGAHMAICRARVPRTRARSYLKEVDKIVLIRNRFDLHRFYCWPILCHIPRCNPLVLRHTSASLSRCNNLKVLGLFVLIQFINIVVVFNIIKIVSADSANTILENNQLNERLIVEQPRGVEML